MARFVSHPLGVVLRCIFIAFKPLWILMMKPIRRFAMQRQNGNVGLNLRVTDTKTFPQGPSDQEYLIRSGTVRDLDGDGYPKVILTVTTYPDQLPLAPLLIDASAGISLVTNTLFPAGAPTVRHSPETSFADINGDGLQDILFADAGLDRPPWTGSGIRVGLNLGGGRYEDVSSLVPSDLQTQRTYSVPAGDIDGDGRTEIILSGDAADGSANTTALLRWNGNGFDAQRNWIARSLWGSPTNLFQSAWLGIYDFDKDGKPDLLATGGHWDPNVRLLFGSSAGFSSANLVQLPEGPFGHTAFETWMDPGVLTAQGADVAPVVIADFNNDGLLDIFSLHEQLVYYKPGVITDTKAANYDDLFKNGGFFSGEIAFQVLMNEGTRHFVDNSKASSIQNLGKRYYQGLMSVDLNNDGFVDVVGNYVTKTYGGDPGFVWGTTLFLNDGTGAFQVVDGTELLSAFITTPSHGRRYSMGSFFPTVVKRDQTEGVFVALVNHSGDQLHRTLDAYKVASDFSIGTGPGFADSASLGAPGFNEFYYLGHYPDAAAAVQAGLYPNGLAHYLAIGMAKGYQPHAPNLLKTPVVTGVSNAASGQAGVVSGSFASIYGSGFTPLASDDWSKFITKGKLPLTGQQLSKTSEGTYATMAAALPVCLGLNPGPCATFSMREERSNR